MRSKVHGQERAALAKQGARVGTSEVSGACGAFAYVGGSMRPMGMERLNALNKTLSYTCCMTTLNANYGLTIYIMVESFVLICIGESNFISSLVMFWNRTPYHR